MKKIFYICFFISVLSACQSTPEKSTNMIIPTPNGVPSASVSNQAVTTPMGEKPAKNPPHGQPYHDCAIAVGAPLSSKNQAPVQVTEVPVQATPVAQPPANSDKEVRLNPPHGQAGHSCKVAVGAPLS